jgi:hypothetical protein
VVARGSQRRGSKCPAPAAPTMHGPGGGPNSEHFAECPGAFARDADIFGLVSELAPLHPRNNTFPARYSCIWPRTRWTGAEPAGPARWPWKDCASGFCPSARSAAGQNKKFQYAVLAAAALHGGANRICWMRSPSGRAMTSGSTACSRRSATSAPPRAGRACRCVRHAGLGYAPWPPSAVTASSGGYGSGRLTAAAADHNGYACASSARGSSGASWAQRIAGGVTAPPLPAAVPAG